MKELNQLQPPRRTADISADGERVTAKAKRLGGELLAAVLSARADELPVEVRARRAELLKEVGDE